MRLRARSGLHCRYLLLPMWIGDTCVYGLVIRSRDTAVPASISVREAEVKVLAAALPRQLSRLVSLEDPEYRVRHTTGSSPRWPSPIGTSKLSSVRWHPLVSGIGAERLPQYVHSLRLMPCPPRIDTVRDDSCVVRVWLNFHRRAAADVGADDNVAHAVTHELAPTW
jgi:hypothetical protein